jgi:hypothetical protein
MGPNHRLTGLTLFADHRPAAAEACFRRALAVAERQERASGRWPPRPPAS